MDVAISSRLRAFESWMRKHGVVCSDVLRLDASEAGGVNVRALAALREGDVVATIPRRACVTPRTSGAAAAIKDAQLGGTLALAVAVMYERAWGAESPWYDYLRLIPDCEPVLLVWSEDEVARLLAGTELDKTVKQDREFLREDWKNVWSHSFLLENWVSSQMILAWRNILLLKVFFRQGPSV
ncbi:fructose-bisphosphate aldolase-lysine N-methyltransferase, chloroplastic isoform X1 [Aegilops tauschii subsp. strangulata]|uniref:SET domain-containing protein n=2 Tax=Aegilops tauschii subsp. strangulata TaxID=200361 RepID=A0A453LBY8_AEGTS|nr:fructose-bisphosphate aldolase-lysine N-methyltransferase, chloroplastic isoform X1 [Aegilops tauschii subsp. strangulata]XP_020146429.1 fructose-bisphosphate aldolase-lysine N-methyltransferase, chloroplastic isoform X1 [Aegilops tauschii subsp. strangulata]XP_044401629.1 fructose-bisphosphate aldolase-lysine N-methyltransferase, chloroplastic-like isoform X1 [Triticum aestivum]XP_044401630.1 fructose-bisphosphate aldolase-lysine N-methyltransferase, chloroplastic-like isoform X1 [Triticum a